MINKMLAEMESPKGRTEMSQEAEVLTPKEWRAVTDRLAELNEKMMKASSSSSSHREVNDGLAKSAMAD
jgi:uncharacterized coiled-coil DUF342 family protein